MKSPSNAKQIPNETWPDTGLLNFFGEERNCIELYLANKPNIASEDVNSPTNSWLQVMIPFAKNDKLRQRFSRFYSNSVRIGRLLEMLDYIAGSIAYNYCYQTPYGRTLTLVTATVDHFNFFENITIDKNLYLTGYVTFVGNSSMEIRLDMSHEKDNQEVGTASFVFVARNKDDHTKSVRVPKLIFDGEEDMEKCILRNELGKGNQVQRKKFSAASVFKIPPSGEESILLHKLFQLTFNKQNCLAQNPNMKFILDTKIEKTLIMHVQEKNIHGKIFGGYLMREAFEISWLCAHLYAKGEYPEIIHIDDINFLTPVDVGSALTFSAYVTYTEGSLIHVLVTCEKIVPFTCERIKTTELHLTFLIKNQVQQIIPENYETGMMYLEAKRRVLNII